jgi:6-phosphogluconolactonase (cycloisomerase 2 family)
LVEPTGKYLYVSASAVGVYGTANIYVFSINPNNGSLTYKTTFNLGGLYAQTLKISQDGRYLYSISNDGYIYQIKINQNTGELTTIGDALTSSPSSYAYVGGSTSSTRALDIDIFNRFVYAVNTINNRITQFSVGSFKSGQTNILAGVPSTSNATGSLVVQGGAGVTGNVFAGGTVSTDGVFLNSNTITSNTVIPSGYNGFAVGPITIANNVTLTVSSNSRWLLL